VIDAAYQRLMMIRGAELPLLDKIRDIAASDQWSPDSYAAFLLARPITWRPIDQGLRLYTSLIREMSDENPQRLAVWCSTALYGACQTITPAAVPAVASSLAAWTILTTRDGNLLASLMATCPPIIRQFAGEVDFLGGVALQIVANLRQVFPAEHVPAVFIPLLQGLNEADRSRAMQLLLTAP
jgi:hypothetical protein